MSGEITAIKRTDKGDEHSGFILSNVIDVSSDRKQWMHGFGDGHLQWFDVQDYITEEDETFAKVNITPKLIFSNGMGHITRCTC